MLFVVIEHYRGGDAAPVYARFHAQGRFAPDGLRYGRAALRPEFVSQAGGRRGAYPVASRLADCQPNCTSPRRSASRQFS